MHASLDGDLVDKPTNYEDLLRLARLPTLRSLELDYMPVFNEGLRPGCCLQSFSGITTLILHDACLSEHLRYVFAWFKSLEVLEIDWTETHVRGELPHADDNRIFIA